jgi:hypothetical protein
VHQFNILLLILQARNRLKSIPYPNKTMQLYIHQPEKTKSKINKLIHSPKPNCTCFPPKPIHSISHFWFEPTVPKSVKPMCGAGLTSAADCFHHWLFEILIADLPTAGTRLLAATRFASDNTTSRCHKFCMPSTMPCHNFSSSTTTSRLSIGKLA